MKLVTRFIGCLLLIASYSTLANQPSFTLLYGSCLHQDKPQPIWNAINREPGDVFMLLGDNIYGDSEDPDVLAAKYKKQWQVEGFVQQRQRMPLIGIWDDHDFGVNDGGKEYPSKEASRQLMLDYFNEAKDSARRTRADGIYTSYIYGEAPHRVQIILPDLRWNRDAINHVTKVEYLAQKAPKNMGPYLPTTESGATMLGEKQWQWLEQQLQIPAEVRIIGSSLQLLPEFTGWEAWANFPADRQRLMDLLDKYQVNNLLILSGDTHWGELSKVIRKNGQPLYEMTSSGLTETWHDVSPNQHRISKSFAHANYGVVKIDWLGQPNISLTLKDVEGKAVFNQSFSVSN